MPELPATMPAVEVASYEGPAAARLTDKPVPRPGPGEVLIEVEAAGVNFADVAQTRGLYVGGPKPPYVAGLEVCGRVVARGKGASRWEEGARVIGAGPGAFAGYVCLPEAGLLPLPEGWSAGQGAAFFVQWLTAHGCLRTCGRLVEGETVLVMAAAGGVGQAAVRLANHFGAHVIAAASSAEKLAIAEEHGASALINYREEDVAEAVKKETAGAGADLVLEMVGGPMFDKALNAARPFGRVVVYGSASGKQAQVDNVRLIFRPVEVIGYHLTQLAQKRPDLFLSELDEVQELIAEGVMTPAEPRSFPLAEVAQVLADMEARKTTGKLVLVP